MEFLKGKNILRNLLFVAVALISITLIISFTRSSGQPVALTTNEQVLNATSTIGLPTTYLPEKKEAEEGAPSSALSNLGVPNATLENPLPTDDGESDLLPVEVVSISDFLTIVKDPKETIGDAAVNPITRMTAVPVYATTGSDTPEKIISASYLEAQLPSVLNAFTQKKVDVLAVPGNDIKRVVTPYGYRSMPTTTSSTASEGSGVGFFQILLIGSMIAFLLFLALRSLFAMRARKQLEDSSNEALRPSTRFRDVAGCEEAVDDLQEIVQFLKEPTRFSKAGAVIPKGVLLVGPPGTGKTLLARAVAGEAGVPFYSASGSDFVEMYVGVGAKRVRELFNKARKHDEGAIIFIDEIDSVGRKRSAGGHQNSEQEGTLNALLVEMDGFTKSNVIVIAATNRDDILDPALTRPGRLDRKVSVGLPDRLGREQILNVHCLNKPVREDVDLNLIARRTPGMSGAELAQVVNEACMFAARDDREIVTSEDFDHAVATVAMGKARHSAVVTENDRLVTAWHEAGHTVVGMVLPDAMEPVSVSIIPRGPAGGVTWFSQGDDLFLTRKQAYARLAVAMGGRAAEELLLDGEFTSGPSGDLQQATSTALAMISRYGMTGHGLAVRSDEVLSTGSKITEDVWAEADSLLADALVTARETLNTHRDLFDAIVEGLLEYETLTAAQLQDLQEGKEIQAIDLPVAPKEYRKPKIDIPPINDKTDDIPTQWGGGGNRSGGVIGGFLKGRKRVAGALGAALSDWQSSKEKTR